MVEHRQADLGRRRIARLRSAGFDGLALNFVDYLKELPYFAAEVLPRLERLGLRTATTRQATILL